MKNVLAAHFRCPEEYVKVGVSGQLSGSKGYFSFGRDVTCFGRSTVSDPARHWQAVLPDTLAGAKLNGDHLLLPFDLSEVVMNLRLERYCPDLSLNGHGRVMRSAVRKIYYFLRPIFSVSIRKYLQRINLRGWDKISFPRWPVDFTVETLLEQVIALSLERSGERELPFIWFWPDGYQSSMIMTHDIEGSAGLKFCDELMAIDESFGIRSAFQVVPEERYSHQASGLETFRQRGFEINVHDLNHDGALFGDREEFIRRSARINQYALQFGTRGFRAGAMYRRQDWYDMFDLSYDMSVPNVAHLEPQGGGCCTAFPYFIGNILELPLTTTQDYSLFHIIGDYSIDLWKRQIALISERKGLISFIVHPDYIIKEREQRVYRELLTYLSSIRESSRLWFALPGQVDSWWRNRAAMQITQKHGEWRIEGPDCERARVAFATLKNGRVTYRLQ